MLKFKEEKSGEDSRGTEKMLIIETDKYNKT